VDIIRTKKSVFVKHRIIWHNAWDMKSQSSVPDHQAEDEGESTNHNETKKQKRSNIFFYNLKHRNKQCI
jgi:hypothetical protein